MELVQEKIDQWLAWDRNVQTREQIESLVRANDAEQLRHVLAKRITFGTAGLRGRMQAGFAYMNQLVVIQTTQGIVKYLKEAENSDGDLCRNGVVIGYDGRYNSREFAELSATVFLNGGIRVYMFAEPCPTPFVAFAIGRRRAKFGIMITASHNPKDDNGYKVYGSNGAQIVSPIDKRIETAIGQCLVPKRCSWRTEIIRETDLIEYIGPQTCQQYIAGLKANIPLASCERNWKQNIPFVYTPVHGVGYEYLKMCFDAVHLNNLIAVAEQKQIDPDFPTVKYPNPEEGADCLELAIETANRNSCNLILANDPDADRLAIAERNSQTNQWKIFNGNEIGAFLGYFLLKLFVDTNPDCDRSRLYMLSSTVSSKILKTMAAARGFNFVETLTGFKWMGNESCNLMKNGKTVLFAFEEAIGFMCGTQVLDKDGISAAVYAATFLTEIYATGTTLHETIDCIYREFGYHLTDNSYFICHDDVIITRIFERLRHFDGSSSLTYPKTISNGKFRIRYIRDLTNGYDNEQADNRAVLPTSKSSQMITFTFENGFIVTLRTSGTEPKLKYYSEICDRTGSKRNVSEIRHLLCQMLGAVIEEFLQPETNRLVAKSV